MNWGIVALIAVGISQLVRVLTPTPPSKPLSVPMPPRPLPPDARTLRLTTSSAEEDDWRECHIEQARRVFESLDRQGRLPPDPRHRHNLRLWVKSATLDLTEFREYFRMRQRMLGEPDDDEKACELTHLLNRLGQLSIDLSGP